MGADGEAGDRRAAAPDGEAGDWRAALTGDERALIASAGFGDRVGLGARPAVLVIDVQNYMVGPPPGSTVTDWPSACGTAGARAVAALAGFLSGCREQGVPVVYTRFELARDGGDGGVYLRKRRLLATEGWCLEGSEGAAIVEAVHPASGDIVLVKKKPSAFFGTPLLARLIDLGVDSVIVTGGSTSNCVRATAVDAASYNYRTTIVSDCVFDRFPRSHDTALFDLDRQYADVRTAADVLAEIRTARGSR